MGRNIQVTLRKLAAPQADAVRDFEEIAQGNFFFPPRGVATVDLYVAINHACTEQSPEKVHCAAASGKMMAMECARLPRHWDF